MAEEGFWMVWNPQRNAPRVKHFNRDSAIDEAKRLARENPGEEFVVLQSIGRARRVDVDFVEHGAPLPF